MQLTPEQHEEHAQKMFRLALDKRFPALKRMQMRQLAHRWRQVAEFARSGARAKSSPPPYRAKVPKERELSPPIVEGSQPSARAPYQSLEEMEQDGERASNLAFRRKMAELRKDKPQT